MNSKELRVGDKKSNCDLAWEKHSAKCMSPRPIQEVSEYHFRAGFHAGAQGGIDRVKLLSFLSGSDHTISVYQLEQAILSGEFNFMTTENSEEMEKKWRDEFNNYVSRSYDFLARSQCPDRWDDMEDCYLAGRKASQVEIDIMNDKLKILSAIALGRGEQSNKRQVESLKEENIQLRVYVKDCDLNYQGAINKLKRQVETLKHEYREKLGYLAANKWSDKTAISIEMERLEKEELRDRLEHEVRMIDGAAKDEIEKLKSDLACAVSALEFYGKPENWTDHNEMAVSDDSDTDYQINCGGKRARQALAKIQGESE